MSLKGTIKLEDGSLIQFFETGEVMKTVRGQNTRLTMPEATMYIKNSPNYTYHSKSFEVDGKLVTWPAFKKEVDKLEMPGPHIKDEDYRELYIEHTPLEVERAERAEIQGEEDVDVSLLTTEDNSEEDFEAVVVDPENTGNWWE